MAFTPLNLTSVRKPTPSFTPLSFAPVVPKQTGIVGGVFDYIKSIPSQIKNAAVSSFQQGVQGATQIQQGGGELGGTVTGLEGALKIGAGITGMIFSPLAPVTDLIGKAIQFTGDKLSETPLIKNYAKTATETDVRVLEALQNLGGIAMGILGAKTGELKLKDILPEKLQELSKHPEVIKAVEKVYEVQTEVAKPTPSFKPLEIKPTEAPVAPESAPQGTQTTIQYHGTPSDISAGIKPSAKGTLGEGFYLAKTPEMAGSFSKQTKTITGAGTVTSPKVKVNVFPFDTSPLKLKVLSDKTEITGGIDTYRKSLISQGYDGISLPTETVVFPDSMSKLKQTEVMPKEVKVQKTGAVTKASSEINATIVKQGYEALPAELQSKYTPESYKVELVRAKGLASTNYEDAAARATGKKPVGNYEGQILFNEVERIATENGNYQTLLDLAASPLGKAQSLAGQTLGASGFNDNPNSPVAAIRRVQVARQAALKADMAKETAKETASIKSEVMKEVKTNTRPKWEEFIQSITCGY